MNKLSSFLRIAIAIAAFVIAGTACAMHASIDAECWYAPKQPPPQPTQTTDHNESNV